MRRLTEERKAVATRAYSDESHVDAGVRSTQPTTATPALYGALLYLPDSGLGGALDQYVRSSLALLHELTGERLLLYLVDPGRDPRVKNTEVIKVVRALGVRLDAMPCIVFFETPRQDPKVLTLMLRSYVPHDDPSQSAENVESAMIAVAAAADAAATVPPGERLAWLREELVRAHKRTFVDASAAHPGNRGSAERGLTLATTGLGAVKTLVELAKLLV